MPSVCHHLKGPKTELAVVHIMLVGFLVTSGEEGREEEIRRGTVQYFRSFFLQVVTKLLFQIFYLVF